MNDTNDLIERLLIAFPFSRREVGLLLATAPRRYKVHFIEKRNNRGMRLIAQPTSELKIVQRWIVSNYIESLPVHPAAMAYRKNKNIKDHAQLHAQCKYLLKLDFKDFFPSIKAPDFRNHLARHTSLSLPDQVNLCRLLFREDSANKKLVLSIGAPSSPSLSNTILFSFDNLVDDYCKSAGVRYSRYADDLAFSTSTPHVLDKVLVFVRDVCLSISYPRLQLNEEKTVFSSMKFSRQLTGLVLSNSGTVSVGRTKKRAIRAMAHRFLLNSLPAAEISKLRGLIAFNRAIDGEFVDGIKRMIGSERFNELLNPSGDEVKPN